METIRAGDGTGALEKAIDVLEAIGKQPGGISHFLCHVRGDHRDVIGITMHHIAWIHRHAGAANRHLQIRNVVER